jgi:hypothetical protein
MLLFLLVSCLGRGPQSVQPEDLAKIQPEAAPAVAASESAVETAEAGLVNARREQAGLSVRLAEAQAEDLAARADVDAARAELRAARVHGDRNRIQAARKAVMQANQKHRQSLALLNWRAKSLAVADANVKRFEARRDLRSAQLELQRARAVKSQGIAKRRYNVDTFAENVATRREEVAAADRQVRAATDAAREAHDEWVREVGAVEIPRPARPQNEGPSQGTQ